MTKRNIGDEIIQGMTEAIEYIRGNETGAIVHKVEIPYTLILGSAVFEAY